MGIVFFTKRFPVQLSLSFFQMAFNMGNRNPAASCDAGKQPLVHAAGSGNSRTAT
jgi:hypothetical protein